MKIALLLCWALSALRLQAQGDTPEKTESAARPQIISFDDNTKLTFLGVTRGKYHVAPQYENLGTGNWIRTPDDATVAWIEAEHDPKKWPSFELLVSDKANTGCVPTEKRSASHVRDGVDIQGFVLNAFPRRDKETILRARPYHGAIGEGQFVVANAPQSSFVNWQAEAVPETKSNGDLEITLTNLAVGASLPRFPNDPVLGNDPANQCVRLAFGLLQNGRPVTNWSPWMVYTSDATGNRVQSALRDYPLGGVYDYPTRDNPHPQMLMDGYYYAPGLWPAEPWKVRMEFTRTSGFNDEEILTFTNLPVRVGTQEDADREWSMDPATTNLMLTPANASGVRVKALTPLLFPSQLNNGQKFIRVLIFADFAGAMANPTSQGLRLKLLEATDDQGRMVWTPFNPAWAGHFSLEFPHVRDDIKTLSLKLALHRSRFVEFTVKPTK